MILVDTEGEGDFQPLFDQFDGDSEILWYEPDFTVEAPEASAELPHAPVRSCRGESRPWEPERMEGARDLYKSKRARLRRRLGIDHSDSTSWST